MLNSSNYSYNPEVLNSGEEIGTANAEEIKKPGCKVYFHQVRGAITHLPDGAQITFRGGMFATANPDIQAYLDKICDRRGSMIFSRDQAAGVTDLQRAALAAMVPAGDQRDSSGQIDPTAQVALESLKSSQPANEQSQLLKQVGNVVVKK